MMARQVGIKVARLGAFPCIPHLNSYHFEIDSGLPAEFFYEGDLLLLKRCDAVFMMDNWLESRGARLEKDFAERMSIPVFFDLAELKEWIDSAADGPSFSGKAKAASVIEMPGRDT